MVSRITQNVSFASDVLKYTCRSLYRDATTKKALAVAGALFATFQWEESYGYAALIGAGLLYSAQLYRRSLTAKEQSHNPPDQSKEHHEPKEHLVCEQKINEFRIETHQQGDRYFYRAYDSRNRLVATKKIYGDPIGQELVIKQNAEGGKPKFQLITPDWERNWTCEATKVHLFVSGGRPYWEFETQDQIFQPQRVYIGLKSALPLSETCFEYLRKADFLSYGEDLFTLAGFEKIGTSACSVKFKPNSTASHIDKKMKISPFYWTVTLIKKGNSTTRKESRWEYGHAMLLIESYEQGNYRMRMAHLTKKFGVQIVDISENEYKDYSSCDRSPVWKISAPNAEIMLELMETDDTQLSVIPSIFFPDPNCIEWALGYLHCSLSLTITSSPKILLRGEAPYDYVYPSKDYEDAPYPPEIMTYIYQYGKHIPKDAEIINRDGI